MSVPNYRYDINGTTIIHKSGYPVINGAELYIARDYIKQQRALLQNLQVRQRAASQNRQRAASQNRPRATSQNRPRADSQQPANYYKDIEILLKNAGNNLKDLVSESKNINQSSPQLLELEKVAVYKKIKGIKNTDIENNLNNLRKKNALQNTRLSPIFYFCFTFEKSDSSKTMFSPKKTFSLRLLVYKNNEENPTEYKVGLIGETAILGVKEEKHVFGENDFEATKLVTYVMDHVLIHPENKYFTSDSNGRQWGLELGNITGKGSPVVNEKVDLGDLIKGFYRHSGGIFIAIVPTSNSGGYHKKYTRHHKKYTRRHRKNHTRKY